MGSRFRWTYLDVWERKVFCGKNGPLGNPWLKCEDFLLHTFFHVWRDVIAKTISSRLMPQFKLFPPPTLSAINGNTDRTDLFSYLISIYFCITESGCKSIESRLSISWAINLNYKILIICRSKAVFASYIFYYFYCQWISAEIILF